MVFIMGKVGALEQMRPGQRKKAGEEDRGCRCRLPRKIPESEQEEEEGRPTNGGDYCPLRKVLPMLTSEEKVKVRGSSLEKVPG